MRRPKKYIQLASPRVPHHANWNSDYKYFLFLLNDYIIFDKSSFFDITHRVPHLSVRTKQSTWTIKVGAVNYTVEQSIDSLLLIYVTFHCAASISSWPHSERPQDGLLIVRDKLWRTLADRTIVWHSTSAQCPMVFERSSYDWKAFCFLLLHDDRTPMLTSPGIWPNDWCSERQKVSATCSTCLLSRR